jgi:hypothetical protein
VIDVNRACMAIGVAAAFACAPACEADVEGNGGHGGGASTSSAPTSTSTGEQCDPGSSAGCCFGDGSCCPCVGFDCAYDADHAAIEAFQQCACAADVCAAECPYACQGGGIDVSCFVCAAKVAQTKCATEFAACGGELGFACPPSTCDDCEACSITSGCYDAWHACWFDADCRAIAICSESCTELACMVDCAAGGPPGASLYTAFLECTYCGACAGTCDDAALSCPDG